MQIWMTCSLTKMQAVRANVKKPGVPGFYFFLYRLGKLGYNIKDYAIRKEGNP